MHKILYVPSQFSVIRLNKPLLCLGLHWGQQLNRTDSLIASSLCLLFFSGSWRRATWHYFCLPQQGFTASLCHFTKQADIAQRQCFFCFFASDEIRTSNPEMHTSLGDRFQVKSLVPDPQVQIKSKSLGATPSRKVYLCFMLFNPYVIPQSFRPNFSFCPYLV